MNREFLKFKLRNLRFAVALSDINFTIGSVNPSGIKDEVYFIPKKDISAWPTISDDFLTAEDIEAYTVLDGDFTLVSGKKWIRLYTTQGKGKITGGPIPRLPTKPVALPSMPPTVILSSSSNMMASST